MDIYRHDDAGWVCMVTNALGNVTVYAYDVRGNVTHEAGAVVAKTYADGHGVAYALTDLGQVATRTDARGIVTTYAYNVYGDLVSQTYSDGTPAVTYAYDVFGRQT